MSKHSCVSRLFAAVALTALVAGSNSALANAPDGTSLLHAEDSLFGVDTVVLAADRFDKWAGMEKRHESEINSPEWRDLITRFSTRSRIGVLARVNHAINEVRYVADPDEWRTPLEFLRNGGNCKDYAIAKFMLLRGLGIPASSMQVVGLASRPGLEAHAVLLVETANGPMVLDSLSPQVYPLSNQLIARIVFAVNDKDWWISLNRPTIASVH